MGIDIRSLGDGGTFTDIRIESLVEEPLVTTYNDADGTIASQEHGGTTGVVIDAAGDTVNTKFGDLILVLYSLIKNGFQVGIGSDGLLYFGKGHWYGGEDGLIGRNAQGITQIELNAETGALYAAGRQIQLDMEALRVLEGTPIIQSYEDLRYVVSSLQLDGNTGVYGLLQRSYNKVSGDANLVSNPGFEAGAFTNWTASSGASHEWTVQSALRRSGEYGAKLVTTSDPGGVGATLQADRISTNGKTFCELIVAAYFEDFAAVAGYTAATVAVVKWYDNAVAGGTLLQTDTVYLIRNDRSWQPTYEVLKAPSGALGADIQLCFRADSGTVYVDDISLIASFGGASRLAHIPYGAQIDFGGVLFQKLASWSSLPSGYIGLRASTDGKLYMRDVSTETEIATPTAQGARVLISNSAAKTTLFTRSVGANTLNANGYIDIEIPFIFLNNTGSNQTIAFTVDWGASTPFSAVATANLATGGNKRTGKLKVRIANANATNAQNVYIDWDVSGTASAGSTGNKSGGDTKAGYNTATEDTTAAKTLTISATLSTNSTNLTLETLSPTVSGPFKTA